MIARIYKPAKTAMQSGKAKAANWVLEFEPNAARTIDPLMGWTSGADTQSGQVRLTFLTKDEAISYAQEHELLFTIEEEKQKKAHPKAYADNFAFKRRKAWTH